MKTRCKGAAPADYPGHLVQYCGLDGVYTCPCGWFMQENEIPESRDPHFYMWARHKRISWLLHGDD